MKAKQYYNLKQLKDETWKSFSLINKIKWVFWSTPLSLMWWENKILEWKIRIGKYAGL